MTLYAFNNKIPKVDKTVFLAPTVQIIGDVHIAAQASVWFNAVLRGDMDRIRVGEKTNIQDLCVLHADENIPLTIGNSITIGHQCVIHGCTINDHCLIGMGAIIMNQAVIGRGSVIAAGTVVLEKTEIPPYSLVAGSPGKIKKTYENSQQMEHDIIGMSGVYMDIAERYRANRLFYELPE